MIKETVKDNAFMKMEIYIEVNGQMIKEMIKENKLMQMEQYMEVNDG